MNRLSSAALWMFEHDGQLLLAAALVLSLLLCCWDW